MASLYQDKILIGAGNPSIGGTFDSGGVINDASGIDEFNVTPATAGSAINSAVTALPSHGGTLHFYGGGTDWTLSATVNVNKPNTTIVFHNCRITHGGTGVRNLFNVTAPRVKFLYPNFYVPAATFPEFACINFNDSDSGAGQSYDSIHGKVLYGKFEIGIGNTATLMASAVRIEGDPVSGHQEGRDYLIQGNTFIGVLGTQQTNRYNADASGRFPYGFCGVRAYYAIGVQILNNHFMGAYTATPTAFPNGRFGSAIVIDSCRWTNIYGNVFEYADTKDSLGDGLQAILVTNRRGEGGHINIIGNLSEVFDSENLIEGRALLFAQIVGNNLGRNNVGQGVAIVEGDSESSPGVFSIGSDCIAIFGNNVHNPNGTLAPIQLNNVGTGIVANNTGTLLTEGRPLVSATACANVNIEPSNVVNYKNV